MAKGDPCCKPAVRPRHFLLFPIVALVYLCNLWSSIQLLVVETPEEPSFISPQQERAGVSFQRTEEDRRAGEQGESLRSQDAGGHPKNHDSSVKRIDKLVSIQENNEPMGVNKKQQGNEERIILVTYVFGEEAANKGYLHMFIESARGSGVDIAIVGSPAPPFPLPPNVRHVPITWHGFVERVSSRLFQGRELTGLKNAHPYKINDFKPLIAFLFPEVVRDYDWWGYVDNDLVLGNVRHFLTYDKMKNYDIISVYGAKHKPQITCGPFSVFRNNNVTNHLFQLSALPLDQVFNTSKSRTFDEWGRSLQYNASISGIIHEHSKRLGFRWPWRKNWIRYGNDWSCNRELSNQSKCFDCILTIYPRGGRKQKLIKTKTGKEVMFCHFFRGKPQSEASLADPKFRARLIENGRLRLNMQGFAEVSNTT